MSGDNDLRPCFIPPLAMLLSKAAADMKRRLTEAEVKEVRDRAACIMMSPEHLEKMAQSRGFRDVNPEDCWADWHRLRVEFTGDGFLPKIVLCVVGGNNFRDTAASIIKAAGTEHEWRERDPGMLAAFESSSFRPAPSLLTDDHHAIDSHSTVLYILSKNFTSQEALGTGRSMLELGTRLLKAGGTAMKCESSGIAHSRTRWLELADEAGSNRPWLALLQAFVQLPLQGGDDIYTCGMHLVGRPDLIVSDTLLRRLHGSQKDSGWAAADLFRSFAHYLLAECPDGGFATGHTFSTGTGAPRYRVLWENCTGYEEDDFFFNSFGRWRFTDAAR